MARLSQAWLPPPLALLGKKECATAHPSAAGPPHFLVPILEQLGRNARCPSADSSSPPPKEDAGGLHSQNQPTPPIAERAPPLRVPGSLRRAAFLRPRCSLPRSREKVFLSKGWAIAWRPAPSYGPPMQEPRAERRTLCEANSADASRCLPSPAQSELLLLLLGLVVGAGLPGGGPAAPSKSAWSPRTRFLPATPRKRGSTSAAFPSGGRFHPARMERAEPLATEGAGSAGPNSAHPHFLAFTAVGFKARARPSACRGEPVFTGREKPHHVRGASFHAGACLRRPSTFRPPGRSARLAARSDGLLLPPPLQNTFRAAWVP